MNKAEEIDYHPLHGHEIYQRGNPVSISNAPAWRKEHNLLVKELGDEFFAIIIADTMIKQEP